MAEQRLPVIVPPAWSFRFMNVKTGRLRPYLVPLGEPAWMSIKEAEHMRSDDPVLAVTVAERAYVLPWWVMKNHHVANLRLDGRPVAVTLCERCSSAGAFDPLVNGDLCTFQVVGTWRGTHVLADHQTESIWASFRGECIWGYHRDVRLERLPLLQMSWEDCTNLYSEALVVDGAGESTGRPRLGALAGLSRGAARNIHRCRPASALERAGTGCRSRRRSARLPARESDRGRGSLQRRRRRRRASSSSAAPASTRGPPSSAASATASCGLPRMANRPSMRRRAASGM